MTFRTILSELGQVTMFFGNFKVSERTINVGITDKKVTFGTIVSDMGQ